jgi:hypothetical protein
MSDIILRDMPLLAEPSCRYHQLPDGSMVDVYAVTYDCKVDIVNKKFICRYDDGYEDCELPTFNDLYANGTMGKEGTCIENEYSVCFKRKYKLTEKDIDKLIKEFKKHGFNITKDAIMHNYDAWCVDMKSGYRDEVNNYHLFSPCGCNPLSFRASTLHPKCEDWQHTYVC